MTYTGSTLEEKIIPKLQEFTQILLTKDVPSEEESAEDSQCTAITAFKQIINLVLGYNYTVDL